MNSTKRIIGVGLFLSLFLAISVIGSNGTALATGPSQAPAGLVASISGPTLGPSATASRWNGTLSTLTKVPVRSNAKGLPVRQPPNSLRSGLLPGLPGRAGRSGVSAPLAPVSPRGFPGISGGDPPDPNGDVGPNDIIETINVAFVIYDKAGNTLAGPSNISALFTGVGSPCDVSAAGDFQSDPIVLYDAQADRWLVTILAFNRNSPPTTAGPFYECLAVSQTGDPVAGGWIRYAMVADNSLLNDYPKLGVWPDAYYMTADMYNCNDRPCSSGGFNRARIWALDRTAMLNGNTLTPVYFDDTGVFAPLPSNFRGTPPPSGRPNYIGVVCYCNDSVVHIYKFHYDPVTPLSSTYTGPSDVNVTAWNAPSQNVPQQGTTQTLDNLGPRLMNLLQYRNNGGVESLWASHTVDAGSGVNGVQWFQLSVTGNVVAPAPLQQATFSPDSTHRFMGSIAANKFGDAALGYTASSSSIFPGVRYTGRLSSDAANTMQTEATLANGTTFFDDGGGPPARWGDYTSMTVDPVDDCTFWYVGEHSNQQTRIAALQFSDCSADLAISKTDSPDPVLAGANIKYTINVTNFGPGQAFNVKMDDTTPTNTTFVSVSAPAAWSCTDPGVGNNGLVECTRTSMPLVTDTIYLTVQVNSSTANATVIHNTATVSSDTTDSNPGNNTAKQDTTVQNNADMSVTKTASPDPSVVAGQNLTYSIVVKNNGPTDALAPKMDDTITAPEQFVSVTAPGGWTCGTQPAVGGQGLLECTAATMTANTSATFTVVVKVPSNVAAGTNLSNTACVSATTADSNSDNNCSTKTTSVQTQTDLSVAKTVVNAGGQPPYLAGTDVTYQIVVTNHGPSDAQAVVVTDELLPADPQYTTFKSMTVPTGWLCELPAAGAAYGGATCDVTSLNGDPTAGATTATFTLVLHVIPSTPDNTVLTNTVKVESSTPESDPTNTDNYATAPVTIFTEASITVLKTASPSPDVIAGTDITYTITLKNTGPSDAQSVDMNDPLPAAVTFTSLSAPASWSCTDPGVGNSGTVDCTEPTMAFNETATFVIVAHLLSSTPASSCPTNGLKDIATVTWTDHTNGDNTQSGQQCDNIKTKASFSVVKTSVITGVAGAGSIQYTVTITNNGPSDQLNVTFKDPLDVVQLAYVNSSADGGGSCSFTSPNVNCSWADITAGTTVHVTINATLNEIALNLCNTGTVYWTDSFGAKSKAGSICETVPTQAEASIVKTAKVVGTGLAIQYTIVMTTTGPSRDRNVVITDPINTATAFVSVSVTEVTATPPLATVPKCSYSGKTVKLTCNLGDMKPNSVATIILQVKWKKTVRLIKNTASISQTTFDSNLADNTSTITVRIGGGNAPDTGGGSSSDPGSANPPGSTSLNVPEVVEYILPQT